MAATGSKTKDKWFYLGPLFVIIGAALWGVETKFRVGLNEKFDSEILVFYEHLFCLILAVPLALRSFKASLRAPRSSWTYLLLSGVLGSAVGTTFFTLSLTKLNASVANLLLNFQPIVSVIFANLLLREKLGRGFFVWSAMALACGGVIAADDFSFSLWQWNIGLLFTFITALTWGFSTVAGRGAMKFIPLGTASAGRFLFGGLAIFISLVVQGKFTGAFLKWPQLGDQHVIYNYLGLSIISGVVPLYFYFKGLSKTSATVAGFCELTQTFTALLVTWGFMGQPLTMHQVIAGLLLLVCVYMINLNFSKANASLR